MSYGSRLEDLLALTQMGAVSGPDALSSLYSLQDQRQAQRHERQAQAMGAAQAQQDSALDLASLAYSSASEGDPLAALLQNPQFVAGANNLNVDPLQVAKGYYGPGGVSQLNPTLNPDSEADVFNIIRVGVQNGETDDAALTAGVHNAIRPDYGEAYTLVRPTVDKLIQDALKQYRGY